MKRRKKMTTYLAGPMEFTNGNGKHWRLRYKQELDKLNIDCVIPEFEEKFITDGEDLNKLKKKDIAQYINIMRQLIKLDLQFVKDVDIVVVRWAGERMSGTIGEVQQAFLIGKPVYLVTELPLHKVPGWFLACCTECFSSLKDLVTFIQQNHS